MLKKKPLKNFTNFFINHWLSTLLIALAFVAVLSSLLAIGQNIWFDEGYSIYVAQKPIAEIISLVSVDAHPPFYYVILKLWGSLFGWNEFTLRFLSIIFATASVAITFFIVKKLAGVKVALGVLPFLILAPFALRYSYEIRPYALTSTLVTGGTLLLLLASQSKKRALWIYYSIIVALGMLTLYMSALIWAAHAIWLAFSYWKDKKATPIKIWFSSYILAIILFSPWMPTFISQTVNSALPGIGQPINLTTGVDSISHLMFYQSAWQTNEVQTALIAFVAISLIVLLVKLWEKSNVKTRNNLLFIGAITIIPFLILVFANALSSNNFYISRYLAHFAIFYYMAIGFIIVCSYKLAPKLSFFTGAAAIIILTSGVINLAIIGNFNFERNQKPATKIALSGFSCNKDTTFVAQDEYTYLDSWFYLQGCNLKFIKEGQVSNRGGYAPLRNSSAQIQNINEVSTPNVIFISWKDKNNEPVFMNSNFHLVQSDVFEQHLIETYTQNVSNNIK